MLAQYEYRPQVCDLASERDRVWFANNPDRAHRLRPAHEGELPGLKTPEEGWAFVAVRQVHTGLRVRLPFASNEFPPADEKTAALLFSALLGEDAQ